MESIAWLSRSLVDFGILAGDEEVEEEPKLKRYISVFDGLASGVILMDDLAVRVFIRLERR